MKKHVEDDNILHNSKSNIKKRHTNIIYHHNHQEIKKIQKNKQ